MHGTAAGRSATLGECRKEESSWQNAPYRSYGLNFSYRYKIRDLDIGAEDVVGTLSFSGRDFRCELPWSAIFAHHH